MKKLVDPAAQVWLFAMPKRGLKSTEKPRHSRAQRPSPGAGIHGLVSLMQRSVPQVQKNSEIDERHFGGVYDFESETLPPAPRQPA
ncbi:hypothetical protein [Hydrogenophaga defluvii]|uniref:hypothetical protein n=1 Tax=Hydrogenophaga defluvii TaxID=249410 RepID=UPI0036D41CF4